MAGIQTARATEDVRAEDVHLVTTDYFLSHESKEPFYREQNLDPHVVLHVREVVAAGTERTAGKDNKVLLFVHGGTFPGYVAFDLDYENVSMMRHFASLGWDTFALDLEGYGQSTRPPIMDEPDEYPDSKAPIGVDVAVDNVERTVDFIRNLRGVDKVHLLGWSSGAMVEAPRYAIQYPDKVAKLILYASKYQGKGKTAEERRQQDAKREAEKNRYGTPADIQRWVKLGTKEEYLIPGAFEAYVQAHLASDPKSAELGGRVRAPWGRFIGWPEPHFDAGSIKVPTLVIRGETDSLASREDNQQLLNDLGSTEKKYVEIEQAGHMIQFEKNNKAFYRAIAEFLEPTE
ncbi:MAG: alpha/beta hydrolase [Thiohalocapsa sp.]|nr:alpha/beta hydrolase [Thiohalocapsa sp.]MCF7990748.1 alpha/beta hydrolase [Thiohalocapsa sp.]